VTVDHIPSDVGCEQRVMKQMLGSRCPGVDADHAIVVHAGNASRPGILDSFCAHHARRGVDVWKPDTRFSHEGRVKVVAAWGAHDLNSIGSSAEANSVLLRGLVYLNCNVLPLLAPAATINPTVNVLVGLVNPPSKAACQSAGILKGAGASAARGKSRAPAGGVFSGLNQHPFGRKG